MGFVSSHGALRMTFRLYSHIAHSCFMNKFQKPVILPELSPARLIRANIIPMAGGFPPPDAVARI